MVRSIRYLLTIGLILGGFWCATGPSIAERTENLISNGTFGGGLGGWTNDVTPKPDLQSGAQILYNPSKGINSADGAAEVALTARKDILFMPWLGAQFRSPAGLIELELIAWHRSEARVPPGATVSVFELIKLEDDAGKIVAMEVEKPPHTDSLPHAMTLKIPGANLTAGRSYTMKLFSMATLNSTTVIEASYTVFWDDALVLAHLPDPDMTPVYLVAGAAGAGFAVAAIGIVLVQRRRRAARIDDLFLLHSDGRLIKHFTRTARAKFDSEIVGAMLVAMEQFVKDALGKAAADELTGIEFGGQKIRFVKGRRLLIAAIVTGADEKRSVARMRRALEMMERENAAALESWSGSGSEVGFAKGYMEKLLAGGFER